MNPSYCNRIHMAHESAKAVDYSESKAAEEESADTETSIYHTLLSLYLAPPPGESTKLDQALELLSRHGSRLSADSTLSLIPDSTPVAQLESYFRGRMRSSNSVVNETKIVAGLRRIESMSTQARLLLGDGIPGGQGGRNRRVIVSDERVCGVCHKRLGRSVISVMPDNSVVHYGCIARARSGAHGSLINAQVGEWGRSGVLGN
jgi:hypothetical protein